MFNILADSMQGDGAQLSSALIQALLGFLIVIAGIGVLIFIIWLASIVVKKISDKSNKPKIEKKTTPAPATQKTAPVAVSKKEEPISDEVPDEVKAAIIAAIMAYYSAEKSKAEFTVKRIKRI